MRQWVFAAPTNQPFVVWSEDKGEYVEVIFTDASAVRYVDNTNQAIQAWKDDAAESGLTPFLPPVLKEHAAAGWRGGSIHGAKLSGEGKRAGIYLDVDWLPEVAGSIKARSTNYVSIGTLAHYVDYKGRTWEPIIKELSITEDPRLKNIGAIQDTMALRLSDAITYGASKRMDEQQITDLMASLAKINERLDAIEARQLAVEEVVDEVAPDAIAELEAAEGDEGEDKEKADPALALSEALVKRAVALASKQLGAMRLGDIPASGAPAPRGTRREQGIRKGLTGIALANYTLGV